MIVKGRRTRIALAVMSAVLVVGLVGAITVADGHIVANPWPAREPLSAGLANYVQVPPAAPQYVCPAPVRMPAGMGVGDEQFVLDATTAVYRTGDVITVPGVSASLTAAGDLRGLAASSCLTPGVSHWLVGGNTETGSTALLSITNPSSAPASVTLEVFGPAGQVVLGSRGQLLVGPGETSEVALEAIAPDQRRLAVHVRSTGARVTASIQTQSLAGLLPRGVDFVIPGSAPATTVTIAGVVASGQPADDPLAPVLRLLVPPELTPDGDETSGTVWVEVLGVDGAHQLPGFGEVALTPGEVTDVSLGGLPAGDFVVVVDSDLPLVAAVKYQHSLATPPDALVPGDLIDHAWVAGVSPGDQGGQVALVPGPSASLVMVALDGLGSPTDHHHGVPVTVVARDSDGTELGRSETTLVPQTVQVLSVSGLSGGSGARLLEVITGPDVVVAWGVRLTAPDLITTDALVATLTPTLRPEHHDGVIRVREVAAY